MIQYTNIQRILNLPFDEYLALEGYSHSWLKSQKDGVAPYFEASEKMRLGTLVDALLTQPDEFDFNDPQAEIAQKIASQIKGTFPLMIERFVPQVSYTADMSLAGFKMKTKVRLDWELEGFAPIDLKVTKAKSDKEFAILAEYMGYPNQIHHQAKCGGYKKGYILPYSTKANRCLGIVPYQILERNDFWENNVLKFGSVC